MRRDWIAEWKDRRRRVEWVVVLILLVGSLNAWQRFLGWVETRPGARLADPLLAMIPTADLTWPVFALVYGGLVAGILSLAPSPRALAVGLLSYSLMIFVRIPVMWLVPLDPPEGMVLLEDPIVKMVGVAETPTRDLFFSGHTASLCVVAMASRARLFKVLFGSFAAAIGVMVLVQHVHYTIDVVAAPAAAYLAHRLARRVLSSGSGIE